MKIQRVVLCTTKNQTSCPQLINDLAAPKNRRIGISDDFGGKIHMSGKQFSVLVAHAKAGKLDGFK